MVHYAKIRLCDVNVSRFWSLVERLGPDDCWLWQGNLDKDGYGRFYNVGGFERKAHRVSYLVANKTLDNTLEVCHTCDVAGCVNPRHLWQGTQAANMQDMDHKQRRISGSEHKNSRLTEQQARMIKFCQGEGRMIAKQFNVSEALVSRIRNGTCRRYLA